MPALGIGLTMIGFGAMAQDAGLAILPTLGITTLVWGIAGQVALVDIHASGGSLLALFVAVALANLRMFPMVVTGLSSVTGGRKLSVFSRLLLMQTLAISCWTQMMTRANHVPASQRLRYYIGFAVTLISAALLGTAIGHQLGRIVPQGVLTVAIFMTPLYLLLLISGARQWANRLSVIFGIGIGLTLYPVLGDWAVIAAGLLGGTLGFLSAPRLFPSQAKD
ncbi:MAG: AzlC family ABC transporter permease [Alphaproteobacteria bacterium]|nr:AzlC family ABC transporter permease [Alphaproteobacteria bacterium]